MQEVDKRIFDPESSTRPSRERLRRGWTIHARCAVCRGSERRRSRTSRLAAADRSGGFRCSVSAAAPVIRLPGRMKTVTVPFRSYALVSREQIARNFRNVRSVVGPGVEVAGVVKADAYGHGALEVSRVLAAEGARWLAVSSVDEGVSLREGGITGVAHPGDGRIPSV